ncbi:hypothetical protein [Luteibacter rhizovicinus]|uniref:hypothetical protein n=1 Tax=Luteibacter rhizovicinus TaxID=242606 RepID=UPI001048B0A5|nr:hypothetical protein [Luteibacter rhizovicinus]
MFDGFFSGIFGGFVAPVIGRLIKRYRYRTIFLLSGVMANVVLFAHSCRMYGFSKTIENLTSHAVIWPEFLLFVVAGGLAMLIAWTNSVHES